MTMLRDAARAFMPYPDGACPTGASGTRRRARSPG